MEEDNRRLYYFPPSLKTLFSTERVSLSLTLQSSQLTLAGVYFSLRRNLSPSIGIDSFSLQAFLVNWLQEVLVLQVLVITLSTSVLDPGPLHRTAQYGGRRKMAGDEDAGSQ